MTNIKKYIKIIDTVNDHLEIFNKVFKVKPKTTCLECGHKIELKDSKLNLYDNQWHICEECEEEINLKLQCFNNDVEAGINYDLSNQYERK